MDYENICKFIPDRKPSGDITVLNFVYERNCNNLNFNISCSFSMGIVARGKGRLNTEKYTYDLNVGDLFFTFPSKQASFESIENLEYYYISFVGTRASALINRTKVNESRAVICLQNQLIPIWKYAIGMANGNNTDLFAEAVILYTFAVISNTFEEKESDKPDSNIILKIKKYVDSHFDDPELSLKTVSERFLYNDKYISERFRRTLRTGFSDYLKNLRIEHAKKLIKNGFENVTEIAKLCGYSDPFYFSKVFKAELGCSPKKYIEKRGE